ncbi:MAG TPA: DUF3524 domain-containing protein [Deltaproteobacteria bacterium]|nr:DUF3524 domain-containing protein [Deltaproteobacteria bacterium]
MAKILLVEPYLTGSHSAWAKGYACASAHDVELLTLEGRYWKWRMHGGAVTLARRFLRKGPRPDVLLATDMLDLTTFLALTRTVTGRTPAALYFHENQLTYPWSPADRDVEKGRDGHYGFINIASALAAERVFFNSSYHMESFVDGAARYLRGLPDHRELQAVKTIAQKSSVLPVGMDLRALDRGSRPRRRGPALVLWNHRWEYDKGPEEFFRALYALDRRGLDFEVAVLGENFRNRPSEFDEARRRLGPRIVRFGYVKERREYARWLHRADILPVTSRHDFFGCSVVEAIYCGVYPLLPRRLAYPEHIPRRLHGRHLYDGYVDLVEKLAAAVKDIDETRKTTLRSAVERYDWSLTAPLYDEALEGMARKAPGASRRP